MYITQCLYVYVFYLVFHCIVWWFWLSIHSLTGKTTVYPMLNSKREENVNCSHVFLLPDVSINSMIKITTINCKFSFTLKGEIMTEALRRLWERAIRNEPPENKDYLNSYVFVCLSLSVKLHTVSSPSLRYHNKIHVKACIYERFRFYLNWQRIPCHEFLQASLRFQTQKN